MQNLTQIHPVTVCECSVWSVCVSVCICVWRRVGGAKCTAYLLLLELLGSIFF